VLGVVLGAADVVKLELVLKGAVVAGDVETIDV